LPEASAIVAGRGGGSASLAEDAVDATQAAFGGMLDGAGVGTEVAGGLDVSEALGAAAATSTVGAG
jgi:hypothetical protein